MFELKPSLVYFCDHVNVRYFQNYVQHVLRDCRDGEYRSHEYNFQFKVNGKNGFYAHCSIHKLCAAVAERARKGERVNEIDVLFRKQRYVR